MGLRCSVLGHKWGDPQIERERQESGAEVVTTVTELKLCARCGAEDVLAENVEVTALPPEEADLAPEDAAVIEDAETGERTVVESGGDPAAAGAAGDAEGSDDAIETPGAAGGDAPAATPSAEEDDGVILDDEDEGEDGEETENWPEPEVDKERADAAEAEDPDPWPEPEPPDPRERVGGGGELIEAPEPAEEGEVEPSDPVDPAKELSAAAEAVERREGDEEDEGEGPRVRPDEVADEVVEVYCRDCDFVDDRPTPSLRAGDACPNCKDSYLSERGR